MATVELLSPDITATISWTATKDVEQYEIVWEREKVAFFTLAAAKTGEVVDCAIKAKLIRMDAGNGMNEDLPAGQIVGHRAQNLGRMGKVPDEHQFISNVLGILHRSYDANVDTTIELVWGGG